MDDKELVALLIESSDDSRDAIQTAERLLAESGSLPALVRLPLPRLRMVEGLGLRRAERLQVAAELGRRVAASSTGEMVSISTDEDVERFMRPLLMGKSHE